MKFLLLFTVPGLLLAAEREKAGLPSEASRAREMESRLTAAKTQEETLAILREGWENPPATYRPHTRWWWPGNAVTKEGIDWQLEQMKARGLGGVEIMSFLKVYDQGNIEFGSPEFLDMVAHTVKKARELGMEVTPPLGPGWNHGHGWVPEEDQAKSLVISEQEVGGGKPEKILLALPEEPPYAKRNGKKLEAVVAVKLDEKGNPDLTQRVDLTSAAVSPKDFSEKPQVEVGTNLPEGQWRIMGFWTVFTGQKCAAEDFDPDSKLVDHFDPAAIRRYAGYMVDRYRKLFGNEFGTTVDSFFGDSFELQQDFLYWSRDLFDRFQKEKGYDLRPYLPMLKYDGAPETPYVRYDVGSFLHELGMEGIIGTMADYSAEAGVQMRQQPHYRFTTELIEASGRLQRPETENTKRSFDPMFWHKLATSGAQFYPSKDKRWVSAEAFTFINDRYRTSMEQIKRATDLFLRDGITQLYNHGYFYTPEKELAPARDLLWMNRISHVNTWWPYYRGLADYQARTAFLGRQGRAEADVLVYSPMPTVWSERAEYPVSHVRDVPFGGLPKTLIASGYDFDMVNDDLLQNHSEVKDGKLVINGFSYSVLVLPRVLFLSPGTLAVLEKFVRGGGTLFALNSLPGKSTGLMGHEEQDKKLGEMVASLFATGGGEKKVGEGVTFFLPDCDGFDYLKRWAPGAVEWEPTPPLSPAYARFVELLRSRLVPDFEIPETPLSNGLTFRHTRIGPVDAWFVANLQPVPEKKEILLNTRDRFPQIWNPMTAAITAARKFRTTGDGRLAVELDLQPWESLFVLVTPRADSSLKPAAPEFVPKASFPLEGPWEADFAGLGGMKSHLTLAKLVDWTTLPGLGNFSGTVLYTMEADLPVAFAEKGKTIFLDLGEVHEVAEVMVNGSPAGVAWMQPYRVNVSGLLKPGKNKIQIRVANLLWNYAAGMTGPNPIPEELQAHYGATWKKNYNGWNALQITKKSKKDDRLPSGLLGPVTLNSN